MGINVTGTGDNIPVISLEEAHNFIKASKKNNILIGAGVMLCMLGVALLILVSQLADDKIILKTFSRDSRDYLSIVPLLTFIATVVGLFIHSASTLKKYKYITSEDFTTDSMTKSLLNKELELSSLSKRKANITGVSICILSPIAIFLGTLLFNNGDAYGVSILLLMVSIAVFLFIYFNGNESAYKKLLSLGEYSKDRKSPDKVIGAVAAVVWPLSTCIFLLGGFLFDRWEISWIIFVITGILFGSFCNVYHILKSDKR